MSLPPSDRPPTCLAHFVAALKGRMGLTNGGESTYRPQGSLNAVNLDAAGAAFCQERVAR